MKSNFQSIKLNLIEFKSIQRNIMIKKKKERKRKKEKVKSAMARVMVSRAEQSRAESIERRWTRTGRRKNDAIDVRSTPLDHLRDEQRESELRSAIGRQKGPQRRQKGRVCAL